MNESNVNDNINSPERYKGHKGIECIDVMEQQFGTYETYSFCLGNIMKYVYRVKCKDDELSNLLKAKWYINKAIELYDKKL